MMKRVMTMLTMTLSLGCAGVLPSMPETGAAATSEPLSVRTETRAHTYTTSEKAGEVVHRDDAGRTVGTSEVYVDKQETVYYDVWFTYQGERPIDEADFYRIAGEDDVFESIEKQRKRAYTLNRVGIFGGAAAYGGALALFYTGRTQNGGRAALYAGTGLLLTGAVGWAVGYFAGRKLHEDYRFTDSHTAAGVANSYNASSGGVSELAE